MTAILKIVRKHQYFVWKYLYHHAQFQLSWSNFHETKLPTPKQRVTSEFEMSPISYVVH